MAAGPTVMLLDKLIAGIDPLTIALKMSGVGVLVTDYDLPDLFEITRSSTVPVIYDRRDLAHGPSEALAKDEGVRRLSLGKDFRF